MEQCSEYLYQRLVRCSIHRRRGDSHTQGTFLFTGYLAARRARLHSNVKADTARHGTYGDGHRTFG